MDNLDTPIVKSEQNLAVTSLAFSNKTRKLAIANMENSVNVYSLDNSYALYTSIPASTIKSWKIDFDPSGKYLLCGTTSLCFVNIDDGKKQPEFGLGSRFITALKCSPSGKLIASGNIDGGIIFYNAETCERAAKLEDHGLTIRDLAFAPDESFMLSVSDDMHINITNMYF